MKRDYRGKKADTFYTSARWRHARESCLQRDGYWCQKCKKRPATMVHHIIPREEAPEKELDLDNLESLCYTCHNKMHPEKGAKTRKHFEKEPDLSDIRIFTP